LSGAILARFFLSFSAGPKPRLSARFGPVARSFGPVLFWPLAASSALAATAGFYFFGLAATCLPANSYQMKFFIDTANLAEIQEAVDLGVLDGVTTNPSLMAKEGIRGTDAVMAHYRAICDIVDGDVSAEVIATDFDGIIREGEALADLHPNIVVKVPMIKEGVKAIKYFSDKGIRTNCTLIFSAGQALLAAKAGATYVSPFVGRLDDIGADGLGLIAQIIEIFANYGYATEVLAASVRHVPHLIQCAELGADVVTCPLNVITGLLNHPLTDKGLATFLADHRKVNA
jgi:transaldolase